MVEDLVSKSSPSTMMKLLDELEKSAGTPREIVSLRRRYLENESQQGLASTLAPLTGESIDAFLDHLKTLGSEGLLSSHSTALLLKRILNLFLHLSRSDSTLGEELGRAGPHVQLMKLIRYDISNHDSEEQQDCIIEMQDLACEIGRYSQRWSMPYSVEDLQARLPLIFDIAPAAGKNMNAEQEGSEEILIRQVTTRQTEQKDVGFGRCFILCV